MEHKHFFNSRQLSHSDRVCLHLLYQSRTERVYRPATQRILDDRAQRLPRYLSRQSSVTWRPLLPQSPCSWTWRSPVQEDLITGSTSGKDTSSRGSSEALFADFLNGFLLFDFVPCERLVTKAPLTLLKISGLDGFRLPSCLTKPCRTSILDELCLRLTQSSLTRKLSIACAIVVLPENMIPCTCTLTCLMVMNAHTRLAPAREATPAPESDLGMETTVRGLMALPMRVE